MGGRWTQTDEEISVEIAETKGADGRLAGNMKRNSKGLGGKITVEGFGKDQMNINKLGALRGN